MTEKLHYYKTTIEPDLPSGVIRLYNHTNGLCGLTKRVALEKPVKYLGYMTNEGAMEIVASGNYGEMRVKHNRRGSVR